MPFNTGRFVQKFLETFSIEIKQQDREVVLETLGQHLDAVVYNITSIAVIFTLLKGGVQVQPKHLVDVTNYVMAYCSPRSSKSSSQSGGSVGAHMPSDYFGYPHPNYDAANENQGIVMSEVNFQAGIARGGINSLIGGAGPRSRTIAVGDANVKVFVRSILKLHNMKISKTALISLLRTVDIHLNCLATDLAHNSPITKSRIQKVLDKKSHAIFH
jgi:hypothetical protein